MVGWIAVSLPLWSACSDACAQSVTRRPLFSRSMKMSSFRPIALGLLMAAGLLAAISGQPAMAHATMVKSVPAANSRVPPPAHVEVTLNERVLERASRLKVMRRGKDGAPAVVVDSTTQLVAGTTLRASPREPLSAGEYEVEWRAVGPDNHPMTGRFRFHVH
ncbi:copper resistance protein CopC [Luteimonas sp. WGS1318]|uniref:copper resistance protein CopC n=1 Tax=Luteimonas sp. WGS1318 TaxID=3366815 RepID=UPI00372D0FE1